MNKPIQKVDIICDSCNSSFSPEDIEIKEEYVKLCGDKVRVIYYRCPICNKFYLIGIHNYISDKLLKKQQEFTKSCQKKLRKGLPVSKEKLEQIEEIKESLLDYQDVLQSRYKDGIHLLDQQLKQAGK